MSFIYNMSDTWNAGGTTFDAIKMNISNGAGGAPVGAAASRAIRIQANGTDVFGCDISGNLYPTAIQGTQTNNSAAAGFIGEILSSVVLVGAQIALTSGAVANIASIALTAGDWDITGVVAYAGDATTQVGVMQGIISTTNNGGVDGNNLGTGAVTINNASGGLIVNGQNYAMGVGPFRVSQASTNTYYLNTNVTFAIGTMAAFGSIRARRVR